VYPNDGGFSTLTNDYGPTVSTDIDPNGNTTFPANFPCNPVPPQGCDPRYLSPYTQNQYGGVTPMSTYLPAVNSAAPGPADGSDLYRRQLRWAKPDECFGVSCTPHNKYRPDHEVAPWRDARRYLRCSGQ
jgi:hypothetical protein